MSLGRLGVRVATCRALSGATIAEARVFDSAIDPIDRTIAQMRAPVLIVTTDDHAAETVSGRDVQGAAASCDLVIEAAIASRVELKDPDGGAAEASIEVPHTDEGMELMLDLLEHQVLATLLEGRNPWAAAWLAMVPRIHKRHSRRGADSDKGVRFAARQIVLSIDLVEPPVTGAQVPENSAWSGLLSLMDADAELEDIATWLRAEIEGAPLTDWRRAARALAIPLDVSDGMGLGPVLDLDDDPEELGEIEIVGAENVIVIEDEDED